MPEHDVRFTPPLLHGIFGLHNRRSIEVKRILTRHIYQTPSESTLPPQSHPIYAIMSFTDVGKAFAQHYYSLFANQRQQLGGVYRANSLMTWQSDQMQGVDSILARFQNLGFTEAQFKSDSIDCQPSLSGGVLVVVNGEVLLKDERHPLKFVDMFHLAQDAGQWYVSNQIFNIIGGGGQ